jgi:hypothetical protein
VRIRIKALGFPLTATLLEYTERRLRDALARVHGRVRRVVVCLGEADVSRRGADKYCRMHVYLQHSPAVLIEDTDADLHAVIGRVSERAGRRAAACVDRQHDDGVRAVSGPRRASVLCAGAHR